MRQAVIQKAEERQRRQQPNLTGIPTQMRLDFEERIGALAYTQIPEVYMGPGQERHLRHELSPVVQFKKPDIGKVADDDEAMCDGETAAEAVDDEVVDADDLESPHLFEKDSRKRTKLLKQARRFRRWPKRDESPEKILGSRTRRDPFLRLISMVDKDSAKVAIKRRFIITLVQRLQTWSSTVESDLKSGITVYDSAKYTIRTVRGFFAFLVKHRDDLSSDTQYANPWFLSAILTSLADMHIVKIQWPILLDFITCAQVYYMKFKDVFDVTDADRVPKIFNSWLIFYDITNVSKRIRPNWSNRKLNVSGVEEKYGVKFVGIHYTRIENAVKLHGQHPCALLIGDSNGAARGNGFYFFPSDRLPSKRIDSVFGEMPMAVFVQPEVSTIADAEPSQDKIDDSSVIVRFDNGEAVIPTSLFDKTIIMSCFSEIVDLFASSSENLAESLYIQTKYPQRKKR